MLIKRIAHAVETLELETFDASSTLENGCNRQSIMCRKLRIDTRTRFQHTLCTRNIIQIRHRLACEDGIIVKAALLCALHFRIPIGALYKTHHHAAIVMGREIVDPVDHFHGATDILLKPLEGVLAGLCGIAGTALMGDGSVLMVLNPKELL